MVPSVSSALPTALTAAAAPAAKTASAPAQVKPPDASGSTVPEIVLQTGLDTATVKRYLNE